MHIFATMDDLAKLSYRLPELEWKLSQLGDSWSAHSLPPGLFTSSIEITAHHCINEIKENLRRLSAQTNQRCALSLADKINQQINVLVRICTLHANKPNKNTVTRFGVQSISTRQQWLVTLHDDIERLTNQQQSLTHTLKTHQVNNVQNSIIQRLQQELGEVERKLTIAKENLVKATDWS